MFALSDRDIPGLSNWKPVQENRWKRLPYTLINLSDDWGLAGGSQIYCCVPERQSAVVSGLWIEDCGLETMENNDETYRLSI